MKIRQATVKDKKEAMAIAKSLNEWFNKDGIKNMAIDFKMNHVIVAKEKKKVLGFLSYTTYSGKMLLLWMGVYKGIQRSGVGKALVDWLVKESKRFKLYSIEVETLPEEDIYKPYERTRAFYYKNGFERVLYKKARVKGWDDQIVLEKKIK
ncbi:MAG: acetyltransferase [archaeon GW2011_AR17]|nr:MAG: acetyltransferase [archaeon GW2011_AR17]MBS3154805.1 GNAT family N-acetyltransferase [Candidatus Woesearchaeota archaeon]HIH15764.1 GNAT family N-acetyltransferase [Nanoarchaeota archaeon]HIH58979.1 GNAT family N-acetyltransferase [Nanoarchaeota archaeon]HII14356.1 GNAT family N-acetyltransferase [Nanoarchaeota archaeon]